MFLFNLFYAVCSMVEAVNIDIHTSLAEICQCDGVEEAKEAELEWRHWLLNGGWCFTLKRSSLYPGFIVTEEASFFDALVDLILESNDDDPGYDRWSAIAALDSMLDEENGSLSAVATRLKE